MANLYAQFDSPAAEAPGAPNVYAQFDAPPAQAGANIYAQFDGATKAQAAQGPDADPDALPEDGAGPPIPQLNAYTPSLWESIRQALSPILGETSRQTSERRAEQSQLSTIAPAIAHQIMSDPNYDLHQKQMQEGGLSAVSQMMFTPAPGTPQLPMKKSAPGDSPASQVGAGLYDVGAGVVNSLPTPGGALALMGGVPLKIVQAILTPLLAKSAIENAPQTYRTIVDPQASLQQKTVAIGNEALAVIGAYAGGRDMLPEGASGAPAADVPSDSAPNTGAAESSPPATTAPDPEQVNQEMQVAGDDFFSPTPDPEPIKENTTLGDLVGKPVRYEGSGGTLVRDEDGNFVVMRKTGMLPIEVADTGKSPDILAHEVGIVPELGYDYGVKSADDVPPNYVAPAGSNAPAVQFLNNEGGFVDPKTLSLLGRTSAGALLGYYSGDNPQDKMRNAAIGALAALGAPKIVGLLGGRAAGDTASPVEDAGAAAPVDQGAVATGAGGIGEAPGTGVLKQRGFVQSVQDSPDISPEVKGLVSGMYDTKTRAGVQQFAKNLVDALVQQQPETGLQQAKAAFMSSAGSPTAESWAVGLELARRFDANKDFAQSADVLTQISKQATTPARALNFLGTLDKTSVEGIGLYVQKMAKAAGLDDFNPLTADTRSKIQDLQAAVGAAGSPETKLARQAELFQFVNDLVPVPAAQKIARSLPLALIFHTKVFIKKALGDTGQMVMRTAADNVVPALDAAYSVITNTGRTRTWVSMADQFKGLGQPIVDFKAGFADARKQGAEVWPSIQSGAKTVSTLAKLATKSSYLDNGITDIRGALRHTYSSAVGRAAEDAIGVGMGIPTRAAYMRAFQSRMAMEMKTARVNGAELVNPSEDMVDRAHLAGMEATFSHENPFSDTLAGVRKILNFGQPLGIGSAVAPLTKVPGGVMDMAVRYSPLGFVRAAYKGGLAQLFGKPEAVDRGAALDAFTQAGMGSAGLVGTGYWLAKNQIIRGAPEENKDAEAVRQASGFGKYSVNLSALKRMMVTGQFDRPDHGQVGDLIMPYNWAQPIGLGLAMGAEIWHQGEMGRRAATKQGLVDRSSSMAQGLLGTSRSLENMELFTGLNRLANDTSSYGLLPGLGMQALNLPGMLVPSIFRDVRNLQDNNVRQLQVSNSVQTATNRLLERIPFLADKMGYPAAYDRFGQAIQRYDVGTNGWANVLLNPTYFSTLKANPVGKEVVRLWQGSGDTSFLPRSVPMTAEIRNPAGQRQTVTLTPQQISDLQHWEGTLTKGFYLQLMSNPRYVALDDANKAKYLAELQQGVHEAGKVAFLGDNPAGPNGRARNLGSVAQAALVQAMRSPALADVNKTSALMRALQPAQN